MGVVAFWIALAAVLIAGSWFKSRTEAQKHETVRRIVEKTGQVDEEKLRDLIVGPKHSFDLAAWQAWRRADAAANAGAGYTVLRVFGTVAMFVGVGMAVCFGILWGADVGLREQAFIGLAIAPVVAAVGAGLFFASRFADPPPRLGKDGGPGA